MDNLDLRIDLLSFEEDYGKKQTAAILNTGEIFWRVSIPICLYTAINVIFSEYLSEFISSAAGMFIMLIAYVFLLIFVACLILSYKNNYCDKNCELSNRQISAIFDAILLLNFAYHFACGIFKDGNDIVYIMSLTNLTLYVGFAVSLDDLFAARNFYDILKCFYSPFSNIQINKYVYFSLMPILLLTLAQLFCKENAFIIIIYLFILLFFVSFLILDKIRKERMNCFIFSLLKIFSSKKVLFLQIGTDYILIKSIKKSLDSKNAINKLNNVKDEKYNVVLVLNTLSDKEKIFSYFDKIINNLETDVIIIDPFANKRRRNSLAAWFGIPNPRIEKFSLNEYKKLLLE